MYFDILHAFCHSDKRKICAEVGKNWEALLADVLLALRFVREGLLPVLMPAATLGSRNLTLAERLRALPELRSVLFIQGGCG